MKETSFDAIWTELRSEFFGYVAELESGGKRRARPLPPGVFYLNEYGIITSYNLCEFSREKFTGQNFFDRCAQAQGFSAYYAEFLNNPYAPARIVYDGLEMKITFLWLPNSKAIALCKRGGAQ